MYGARESEELICMITLNQIKRSISAVKKSIHLLIKQE